MLGASRWQAFWRITLPLLTPAILAASLLVFVFCFTSFGTVLILGGPRLATLEVEIYRQAVHLFNLPIAAALSLVQIIFTFALMAVYTWFEKKSAVSMMPGMDSSGIPARTKRSRWIIRGSLGFLALLLGAPLAALLISSVWGDGGPTLAYYLGLFTSREQSILYVPPFGAMLNSLGYALAASLIAVALGWFAAGFLASPHSRSASWLDPILMLPLSTSAVTLGFGFIIALDEPPLNLRTSWILPALAHAMVAFPFVLRSLLPAWRGIPNSLREAAAMLGAPPLMIWRTVDWPILRRALLVGAVFAFAISMGEFGATVFVARPQTPTLPLAIYRFLGHPGVMNYGQAMAMSCVLMMTTAAGFLMLDRFQQNQESD
jgi:thiamine transport system permease protein